MQFILTFTTLLAVTASVIAAPAPPASKPKGIFRHEHGTPDGLYTHHMALDGTVHNQYLGKPNVTTTTSTTSSKSKRWTRPLGVICQDLVFSADDATQAIAGLANQLNTNPHFTNSISYTSGTATAYGCDYAGGQTITGAAISDYLNLVTMQCGNTKEGYYGMGTAGAAWGITTAGDPFC